MIKEKIDAFYLNRRGEKESSNLYVSDAGKCPRAIYFRAKGYAKKAMDARVLRLLDHGGYTHLRIMGVLFSQGIVRASEVEVPPQEMIGGRADAIVSLNNRLYVLEIKSVNKAAFNKLEKPNPDHVKQLQLYLHYFKLKDGIIIYECKDTQNIKEFAVSYDQEGVSLILKDFEGLKRNINEGIVPEIPGEIEKWRCDYCPYAEECIKIASSS